MTDYSKGNIYAIKCNETKDVYIGSTIQMLKERLQRHRNCMKRYNEDKYGYTSSFEIVKYPSCYIELLEAYPCTSKKELLQKEKEYIQSMECVNNRRPCITREEKKEKHNERQKKYREANKNTINKKNKEYREANKDTIKEYQKEYHEANRDTIKQKKEKTRYTCVCGSSSIEAHRRRHEKTKKHIDYIKEIETNGDQKNLNEFFEQFKFKVSL